MPPPPTVTRISSPPMEDIGRISPEIKALVEGAADFNVRYPTYTEPGRKSTLVTLGLEEPVNPDLAQLREKIEDDILGFKPGEGSTVLISQVTDEEEYAEHTQGNKAATNWHQDFESNERGFFFPAPNRTRLVIPMMRGTICAVGEVGIIDAIKIEAVDPSEVADRRTALATGPTVIGADGVLIKSEADPIDADIYEVSPDHLYKIPLETVHRANPTLPEGRVFFLFDAISPE